MRESKKAGVVCGLKLFGGRGMVMEELRASSRSLSDIQRRIGLLVSSCETASSLVVKFIWVRDRHVVVG